MPMPTPTSQTPVRWSAPLRFKVPATPEHTWQAITTSSGVAAWFAPARIDQRQGGTVAWDLGTGMQPAGVVSAWEPPRRFAYQEDWEPLANAPAAKLTTAWQVQAREDGTCVVRLTSGVAASGADWDRELAAVQEGWLVYLHSLRRYLTHFAGQPCTPTHVSGTAPGARDKQQGWAALTSALGLPDADVTNGQRLTTSGPGTPALAGTVEHAGDSAHARGLLLAIDQPVPGTAIISVYSFGGQAYVNLDAYLFGAHSSAVAARQQPAWQAWMAARFPHAEAGSETGTDTTA